MAKVQALLRRAYDFAGQSAYLDLRRPDAQHLRRGGYVPGARAELTRNETAS